MLGRCASLLGALACLLALLGTQPARAQRVLVTTTSLTAAREAGAMYVQSADLDSGAVLPGPELLPGNLSVGGLLAIPGMRIVEAVSTDTSSGEGFVSTLTAVPFRQDNLVNLRSGPESAFVAAGAVASPLELVIARSSTDPLRHGTLDVFPIQGPSFAQGPSFSLSGRAVSMATVPGTPYVAVLLVAQAMQGAVLQVADTATGRMVLDTLDLPPPADAIEANPALVGVTRDGATLLVLTSGYTLEQPSGEHVSWLQPVDTRTFNVGPAVRVPGTPAAGIPGIVAGEDDHVWVLTGSPGRGFGYATAFTIQEASLIKEQEYSYPDAAAPPRIALAPAGPGIALAVDNRLEVWPEGHPQGQPHAYDAAIRTLAWTEEGLMIGEAGRLHRIDPATGGPVATIQFQSGMVTDLLLLPADTLPAPDADGDGLTDGQEDRNGNGVVDPGETGPHNCDTDGDGIHDGADPEPLIVSPRLTAPAVRVFSGTAAGRELQGVRLEPGRATPVGWEVAVDRNEAPWLLCHPTEGVGLPAAFYMSVDPSRYGTPTTIFETALTLTMRGTTPMSHAYGSPATLAVRVTPRRSTVRRILWVWDTPPATSFRHVSDPMGLRVLADLLSAPPLLYTHREATVPLTEPLDSYSVVVLSAKAAAKGAVTRQAILNYVANGGALLFLGDFLPDGHLQPPTTWLSPLGIRVDTTQEVSGAFQASGDSPLTEHWDRFSFTHGAALFTDRPGDILVPGHRGAESAVFIAREYGHGRVAFLAGPTPLESRQMARLENRRFAADLFHWLAQAGKVIEDLDQDGLPNALEDANDNGVVDPGETDPMNADTDSDGLGDGQEDSNRNGRIDPGETSPINPDTDGDGILDGADASPVPAVGAPAIYSLEPDTGPAEGGTAVLISGQNLHADSEIWFGDRRALPQSGAPASNTGIIVNAPRCADPEGGRVDIRLNVSGSDENVTLRDGFNYTPTSSVMVVMRTLEAARTAGALYRGSTSLTLVADPEVAIGRIELTVTPAPASKFRWLNVVVARDASAGERESVVQSQNRGRFSITLTSPGPGRGAGELAVVHWMFPEPSPKETRYLEIVGLRIYAPNGVPLRTTVLPQRLYLVGRPPAATRAPIGPR